MDLRQRLERLRRQSGAAPLPGPSVGERMDRLGRARRTTPPPPDLAAELGGREPAPGLIAIERHFPATGHHGAIPLAQLAERDFQLPEGRFPAGGLAFVDTETSGLAGGTGTVAFLVGIARVAADGLHLRQFLMTRFGAEPALLEAVANTLARSEALVSYNGKSFDLPLLRDRHRLHGHRASYDGLPHLDLVHTTRRLYRDRWPDCRLVTAERRLLGFVREHDLPGAEVPRVWFEFVRHARWEPLPRVLRHNAWDVLTLAALMVPLTEAHMNPAGRKAAALGAARAWLRVGQRERAMTILEAGRDSLDHTGLLALARLYRQCGRAQEGRELSRQIRGTLKRNELAGQDTRSRLPRD